MIVFEKDWASYTEPKTADHLKSTVLAIAVIRNAARALAENHADGLLFWRNAANGGGEVLQVVKGLHEPEAGNVRHYTLELFIAGSNLKAPTVRNTYMGAFHLYVKTLERTAEVGEQLQPVRLSYSAFNSTTIQDGREILDKNPPFLQIAISNAYPVKTDVSSKG